MEITKFSRSDWNWSQKLSFCPETGQGFPLEYDHNAKLFVPAYFYWSFKYFPRFSDFSGKQISCSHNLNSREYIENSDRDRLVQKIFWFWSFWGNPGPLLRQKLTFCEHCIYSFVTHNGKCNRHFIIFITIELN